jgi:hypothetical protein
MSFVRDIKLNAGGDLDFTSGDLHFLDDSLCIIQSISNRLQFWQGEWFLDTRQGMPYFQQIFAKGVNQALIKSIFRNAILTTPGVVSVLNVDLAFNSSSRALTVTWQAKISTGQTVTQSDNLIFPSSSAIPPITSAQVP